MPRAARRGAFHDASRPWRCLATDLDNTAAFDR